MSDLIKKLLIEIAQIENNSKLENHRMRDVNKLSDSEMIPCYALIPYGYSGMERNQEKSHA